MHTCGLSKLISMSWKIIKICEKNILTFVYTKFVIFIDIYDKLLTLILKI